MHYDKYFIYIAYKAIHIQQAGTYVKIISKHFLHIHFSKEIINLKFKNKDTNIRKMFNVNVNSDKQNI